jgi:bacterioferritin
LSAIIKKILEMDEIGGSKCGWPARVDLERSFWQTGLGGTPDDAGRAEPRLQGGETMDKQLSGDLLNKAVADELQAVHQYMYFHFHLDDQGFSPLSALFKRIAIEEMGHVETLAERILFLKGEVELVAAGPVEKITEPEQMLAKAREMEDSSAAWYNDAALKCSANADSASKQLFESLVASEERHSDIYDKQLDNIKRFGPSYLALQSFSPSGEEGTE